MKFVMSKNELSDVVNGVQNIVAQRTPMPILSNILLEADNNELRVTATDLTVGIRCTSQAKVLESGSITLPARRLAQLLRELNVAFIEVSVQENDLAHIVADSSSFRLHGLPRADFPDLPDMKNAEKIFISEKNLKEAFHRTSFAVAKEDTRYVLTGVWMSVQGGTALFIGTDGKRLARATCSVECREEISFDCVIPSRTVDEIGKHLRDTEEKVSLSLMQDKISVESNNRLIISKLLQGEFPDLDQIIPRHFSEVVVLNKEDLATLLRQVSLFISEERQSARFRFHDGFLQVSANSALIGDGKVGMPIPYQGASFEIAFSPPSLLEIIRHSSEEQIYLGFQDPFNPVMISDHEFSKSLEGKSLPSPLYVLMPMRLAEEG